MAIRFPKPFSRFTKVRRLRFGRFASAFFAFPLVAVFFAEAVAARNPLAFFHVVSVHPGSAAFSYVWLLSFFACAYLVIGRLAPLAVLVSILILGSSHAEKLRSLGEPLYLTDVLAQATQLGGLSSFSGVFGKPATWFALAALATLSAAFFFLLRRDVRNGQEEGGLHWKEVRSPRFRASAFAIIALFHAAVFTNAYGTLTAIQTAVALKPEDYSWRQIENYADNGFVGGFFTNLGNAFVKKPDGYDRSEIEKLAASDFGTGSALSGSIRPDVVLILSESFWDPTKLPGVKFSQDPIPNFRKLRLENGGGDFVSPMFWGKTALVEFEVLTGTPIAWLPNGSIPYQQYLRNPVPSVPFEFRSAGYSATAVHTYHKSFFNRSWAYPFLGFEKFVGLEDMPGAQIRGKFVSDRVLTDRVLSELENRVEPEKPAFVFAISMENHFSYEGDKYAEHEIDIEAPSLSEGDRLTLKNYVQGLHNADLELWRLTEELKKSDRPTVVAFFGDHMGILGEGYRIYSKTGYLKTVSDRDWEEEEYFSMHTTPFLVWDNFGQAASSKEEYGKIFAANFSQVVFGAAGLQPEDATFRIPSETPGCLKVPNSKFPNSRACEKALSDWRGLQYFHLFDSK